MKLNGISRINEAGGRYIVLTDYGSEGMTVYEQHDNLAEAVQAALSNTGGPCSIVQLVEVGEL